MNHLVVMAAGTGGHVIPGLAVAREMQARGWTVSWLGTTADEKPSDVRDETDVTRAGTVVTSLDDTTGQSCWAASS